MAEGDRSEMFTNRISYSLPVRLGQWNEELALQEEKSERTNYKRKHCQLLIQKTKRMMRNLLRSTSLAIESLFVLYGSDYQIKTSDLKMMNTPLYLSGVIDEREIEECQHFKHGCLLTASSIRDVCVRNTFKIVGCSGDRTGERVLCGEDVMLQIAESNDYPLYVQCENPTVDSFGKPLQVRLSQIADIYCKFKFLYWDPQKRNETIGTSFSPNTKIIIQHTASGRNLAVETKRWRTTFFGREYMVSCQTYRDTHKMETEENFWSVGSQPKSNKNLFIRAAKGEDVSQKLLEIDY